VVSPIDFSKVLQKAKPVYFPEEGTDLEQVAMAFHAKACHSTRKPDGTPATCNADVSTPGVTAAGGFITNGSPPVVGAPFHNPCMDDRRVILKNGETGRFFSGENLNNPMNVTGRSVFDSNNPRIYKGTNLQFDAVLTKTGYHFPQQRIVALWQVWCRSSGRQSRRSPW
jgi:hypothetical protein